MSASARIGGPPGDEAAIAPSIQGSVGYSRRVKQITRTVGLDDVADLVETPWSACLAYVADGEPEALRVTGRRESERWFVTLPPAASIPDGAPVVLLIDDGEFYFELRGIRVRGTLRGTGDRAREVVPGRITTWDYGAMRKRTT